MLKVRIIIDFGERVASEVSREGVSEEEARSLLQKDDEERRKWTKSLYGVDPWDSNLYDLVVHIHKLKVGDAVDFSKPLNLPLKYVRPLGPRRPLSKGWTIWPCLAR